MFVILTLGIFLVALSGSLISRAVHLLDRLSSFRMRKDLFRTISYLLSNYLFCDIIIIGAPHSAYKKLKIPSQVEVVDVWGVIK